MSDLNLKNSLDLLVKHFENQNNHRDTDFKHVTKQELTAARGKISSDVDNVINTIIFDDNVYKQILDIEIEGFFNDKEISMRDLYTIARVTGYGSLYFSFNPEEDPAHTPDGMKTKLSVLDFTEIPEWQSQEQLQEAFVHIRDDRFLEFSPVLAYSDYFEHHPDFPRYKRRITWSNPELGCHWRAAMVDRHLRELGYPDSYKIFAFGDPLVSKQGYKWWYHIANVFRLGAQVYVMDPVINSQNPVSLEEWVEVLSGEKQAEFAICNALTLTAGSYCFKKDPAKVWDFGSEDQLAPEILEKEDTNKYLIEEWERLLEKGVKNPDEILR